jgi:hypothetical protein
VGRAGHRLFQFAEGGLCPVSGDQEPAQGLRIATWRRVDRPGVASTERSVRITRL